MLNFRLGRRKFKITVNPLVLAVFVLSTAFGMAGEFFGVLLCAALHEAAHMLTAMAFGQSPESITVSPVGISAVIKNICMLPYLKKAAVYLSGPAASLLLAFISRLLGIEFLFFMNLAFFVINIIPANPLDGGRFFTAALSAKTGYIPAVKIMQKIGSAVCALVMLLGVVQAVLYPPNISLFCVGLYAMKAGKKDAAFETSRFLRFCASNEKYAMKRVFPVKSLAVGENCGLKEMLYYLGYDYYRCFYVYGREGDVSAVGEAQLVRRVSEKGLDGCAGCFVNLAGQQG